MAIFVEVECDQKCERCDKSFMCLYYLTTVKKSSAAIHKANERIMLLETIQDRMREKVFRDNSEVLNHDQ